MLGYHGPMARRRGIRLEEHGEPVVDRLIGWLLENKYGKRNGYPTMSDMPMSEIRKLSSAEVDAIWELEIETLARWKREFTAAVKVAMRRKGIFTVPTNPGQIVIHKSAQPGIKYQVTWLDQREQPISHSDEQDLNSAAATAFEGASAKERWKYGK